MSTTVIFVGGTGAKIAHALIHLSAIGLPIHSLNLLFVDQDHTNGNLGKTRSLLRSYQAIRKSAPFQEFHSDGKDRVTIKQPFSTNLDLLAADTLKPLEEEDANLAGELQVARRAHYGTNIEDKLAHALFREDELVDSLTIGFNARPALGMAAIMASDEKGGGASFLSNIASKIPGNTSRIVLAGSMFGGMGASGIPTIASFLAQKFMQAKIIGTLMLPYFEVDKEAQFGPMSDADYGLSLGYYRYILDRARDGFDKLYLFGSDLKFAVPYIDGGGGDIQVNPPLMPEVMGATALVDTFMEALNAAQPVAVSGRKEPDLMRFADLPLPERMNGTDFEWSLRVFSILCLIHNYSLHTPIEGKKYRLLSKLPAYSNHMNINELAKASDGETVVYKEFFGQFLEWCVDLETQDQDGNGMRSTFAGFSDFEYQKQQDSQDGRRVLKSPGSKADFERHFDRILEGRGRITVGEVFRCLASAPPSEDKSHGSFIAALHGQIARICIAARRA